MSRERSARITPGEFTEAVQSWERDYGVKVRVCVLTTYDKALRSYIEVIVYDAPHLTPGAELHRHRGTLNQKDAGVWPSNMLAAVFDALNDLDALPWQWSTKMRKERAR